MENIRQYLDWKSTYTKPKTVQTYAPWVRLFHQLSGKEIEDVDIGDLVRYSNLLKIKYKPTTISMAMGVIHDYTAFWSRRKKLKISIEDVRVPKGKADPKETLTVPEYLSILTWIKADNLQGLRDNCLVRMLYDTGARITEISNLSRGQIDLENRCAYIETLKASEDGTIYWGKDTNFFLKTYLEQKPKKIFPGSRQCARIIEKYAKLAKLNKPVHAHIFRHTRAHLILDNGGNVKDVQFILRHKSPVSSFKYLRLNEGERRKRAIKFLDELTEVDKIG